MEAIKSTCIVKEEDLISKFFVLKFVLISFRDQDPYLGAGDQYEGMAVLQKSAEFSRGGSKRRTNPELQSLIEKQKKYHEDFDKAK